MSLAITTRGVTLRYGNVVALDDLSVSLEAGKIYGLLGRNGSGKTSLLSLVAALRRPSAGEVRVGGEDPFENSTVASQVCLIRESGDLANGDRVRTAIDFAATVRPNFDLDYALGLLEKFELPRRRRIQALSRGQRSALGCVVGLASRAPLTIFDESYLGMDAPSRYAFYDALLADYIEHPRTVIVSTHLIEEVSRLFEEVVLIDKGRLVTHQDMAALLSLGTSVVGPAGAVDRFTSGLTVLGTRDLGPTRAATVYGQLNSTQRDQARADGLELEAVPLQDLFVALTRPDPAKESVR